MTLKKCHQYFVDFTRLSYACALAKSERVKKLRGNLEAYFSDFPLVVDRRNKLGGNFNLFELAFSRPKETACTRILAWFLNAAAEHGQGKVFFTSFLELIKGKYWTKGQPPRVSDAYSVETEVSSKDGRMDLVIRGRDFLLIVEAKIYSGEHSEQLKRYKRFAAESGAENMALVFLTVNGERSRDVPEALSLTWKEVGIKLQQGLYSLDALPLHSSVRLACRDFCSYINTF